GDVLLALALWGAVVALVQRQVLFLTTVPYAVLALLLVSCWSNPWAAARYLSGVHFLLPLLIVEGALGTSTLVRSLRPAWAWWLATGFALALGAVTNLAGETPGTGTLAHLVLLLPALAAAGALAAAWSRRDATAVVAPVLALALVVLACWRLSPLLETSARFQGPEMARARAIFGRNVEPGAVVITTEDVGRPVENIEYYSGVAPALSQTDIAR